MSYRLICEKKGYYLHVTIIGDNTAENVKKYLSEIRSLCIEHKCPNILIEENLTGPGLGIFDIFEIISQEAQNTISMIMRIAFIDINPDHNPSTMKFAENAANNRGVFVKIFSNVGDAEKWLKENRL